MVGNTTYRGVGLNCFFLVLVAALALLAWPTSHASNATPNDHWIGTWATAPQPAIPGSLDTFHNQTLRLIVHTSAGGAKVRIKISNAFG